MNIMLLHLSERWIEIVWRHTHTHTKEEKGLTIDIQAIMPNPLLPIKCRVECLTTQSCPIVFPFYRDADGAGHTECLPIVLQGYHTWRQAGEAGGIEIMEVNNTGEVAKKHFSSQNMPVLTFSLLRHHTYVRGLWAAGRRRDGGEEGISLSFFLMRNQRG